MGHKEHHHDGHSKRSRRCVGKGDRRVEESLRILERNGDKMDPDVVESHLLKAKA
jgi:hypothetical protein